MRLAMNFHPNILNPLLDPGSKYYICLASYTYDFILDDEKLSKRQIFDQLASNLFEPIAMYLSV